MRVFVLKFLVFLLVFTPTLFSHALTVDQPDDEETYQKAKKILDKTDLDIQFLLGSGIYEEAPDDLTYVLFSIRPTLETKFNDYFSVRGELWVNMANTRTQSRFQSPFFGLLNLMEFVASVKPSSYFHFEAGSINQEHFNNRLLIWYRSFPGAVLRSGYESDKFDIKAKFQYAIPTSESFDTDRAESEALPDFTSQGIELAWKPNKRWDISANVNFFQFGNLPAVIACESGRLGNTVIGTECSTSRFAYQFEGLSQAYTVDFQYSPKLSQALDIRLIDNNGAPDDRMRSQLVSTTFNLDLKEISIRPTYGLFFAESDSTPAVYSAFEYGRNNREGSQYGLSLEFKDLGFTLHGSYYDAKLIEPSALQADATYYDLFMEVNLAVF